MYIFWADTTPNGLFYLLLLKSICNLCARLTLSVKPAFREVTLVDAIRVYVGTTHDFHNYVCLALCKFNLLKFLNKVLGRNIKIFMCGFLKKRKYLKFIWRSTLWKNINLSSAIINFYKSDTYRNSIRAIALGKSNWSNRRDLYLLQIIAINNLKTKQIMLKLILKMAKQ